MKPENRTKLALIALEWQGGTVHQICEVFGIEVSDFLYSALGNGFKNNREFMDGWNGIRTCSREYFKEKLIPKHKGDLLFVFGMLRGLNIDYQLP